MGLPYNESAYCSSANSVIAQEAGVLLDPAGLLLHADEAHPLAAATRVLSFTHLWADANGVSHFRDEKLSFEATTPETPLPARPRAPTRIPRLVALPLPGATSITLVMSLECGKRATSKD